MSWDDDGNELVVDGPTTFPVNRRDFLKLTSTGVLVLMSVDALAGQETARPQTGRQGYPTDFNAYLHIGADNKVTCFVGKVELGQGAMTSLPQLLAEDLDVALASVEIVCGDTDLCPWDMGTFGSLSIRAFGPVLRNAAAEARGVLLAMAAERLEAAGRVALGERRRGHRGGRRGEEGDVRPAHRRQAHRAHARVEAGGEAGEGLHHRRHIGAAPRRDREGDGQGEVRRRYRAGRRPARADSQAAGARGRAGRAPIRRRRRRCPASR